MHGKKAQEDIRKGPWKRDEDEVLLNHVNKYGARDWSSIRSKGLLQRTGKSCRLRWVNKLRPNLKNGCKFTQEEENIVIALQAELGNKWAKIATCLDGRTDNDVKNFWSSRQKRLARMLKQPSSTTTSKSQKNKTKVPTVHDVLTLEAPKQSSSSEGESSSSKPQLCSLSCIENAEVIKMVSLPDLIKSEPSPSYHDTNHFEQEFIAPFESYKSTEEHIAFPHNPELQADITFPIRNQDLLTRIDDDPNFIDVFVPVDAYDEFGIGTQHPIEFPSIEPSSGSCRIDTRDIIGSSKNIDIFDDFSEDMFDDMNPPSSPPKL